MVKIVVSGCRDCTVNLDGTECAVEFPANYRVFSVQNMSNSDIIMSVESGKTAADDISRLVIDPFGLAGTGKGFVIAAGIIHTEILLLITGLVQKKFGLPPGRASVRLFPLR